MRNRSTFSTMRELDGTGERRELSFALGGSLLAEIVVACAQMDVRGMDDP